MRDFLKGWKRKVGCVTLVLACVFMVGWMRSKFHRDSVGFEFGSVFYHVISVGSELEFVRIMSTDDPSCCWWPLRLTFSSWDSRFAPFSNGQTLEPLDADREILDLHPEKDEGWKNGGKTVEWLYECGDFHFGSIVYYEQRDHCFLFPYWFFVLPLTLLSTYLLLSKPRPPKPAQIIEP